MMYIVLALACLVASNIAIEVPDKYCQNQESYYTIYQVPSHNCKCTAKQAGALRYHSGKLQVCNGREYEDVCGCSRSSPLGSEDNPATSCRAILDANSEAKSGVYHIKVKDMAMETYCYMGTLCGSRGWTMVMKVNGNKPTFRYDSALWTNKQTYNPVAAAGGLDATETKLNTYSHFSFSKLCLGMRTGGTLRWENLNYHAGSLYDIIYDNKMRSTDMGRDFWKRLVPGSSLQRNCNREGFNVRVGNAAMARIGIISNQENDCNSPDSRIGFGTQGSHCGQNNANSAGNEARCSPDNKDKSTRSFGYIFAQEHLADAPLGSFDNPAPSCKAILDARKEARNGVYYLKLKESGYTRVYCHMDQICGSRGWTILMKIDGHKTTFKYESMYWTHHNVYNTKGVYGGLNNEQMKLETYSHLPFTRLCLGMRVGASSQWLNLDMKRRVPSLFSVIAPNKYVATHLSKTAWRNLVPGSSLQPHCNRQGFNVNPVPNKPAAKVRIGFVSNQENDCHSPDSRVGFGASGTYCHQKSHSAGNEARCGGDKGNKSTPGFGVIFAL